jgi:hypothetical protein
MNSAVVWSSFCGLLALAGCESSSPVPLDVAARRQSQPVRIEFVRSARPYEEGDAFFTAINDSHELLWYAGQGLEAPAFRLKTRNGVADQNVPPARKDARERYPLAPGDRRYFSVNTANAAGESSVGITFYASRTGTNAINVWSAPVIIPAKE